MNDGGIAVLPYGIGIGAKVLPMPLADLHWPLGQPARLQGGTVADLGPQDHLIIYPKTSMHFRRWGVRCPVSVMVVEPRAIHARHLAVLRWTWRRYAHVFTHDPQTLKAVPNARFLPAARTWVPDYATLDLTKSRDVSLIASGRRDLEGHKLRHSIVARDTDAQVMGRGYAPFEHKWEGLAPFRFSVVIENIRAPGYFSEKLVDALLCETVPIYWGAPDVGEYFDLDGLIVCKTEDEIVQAVRSADAARYAQMRDALLRAKRQAEGFADYEVAAARIAAGQ